MSALWWPPRLQQWKLRKWLESSQETFLPASMWVLDPMVVAKGHIKHGMSNIFLVIIRPHYRWIKMWLHNSNMAAIIRGLGLNRYPLALSSYLSYATIMQAYNHTDEYMQTTFVAVSKFIAQTLFSYWQNALLTDNPAKASEAFKEAIGCRRPICWFLWSISNWWLYFCNFCSAVWWKRLHWKPLFVDLFEVRRFQGLLVSRSHTLWVIRSTPYNISLSRVVQVVCRRFIWQQQLNTWWWAYIPYLLIRLTIVLFPNKPKNKHVWIIFNKYEFNHVLEFNKIFILPMTLIRNDCTMDNWGDVLLIRLGAYSHHFSAY